MSALENRPCLTRYHEGLDTVFHYTLNPINDLGSKRNRGCFKKSTDTLADCFKTIPLHYADKCAVFSSYYINSIGGAQHSSNDSEYYFNSIDGKYPSVTGRGLGAAILRTIALVFSVLARIAVFTVVLTVAAVFSYLIPILPLVAYYQAKASEARDLEASRAYYQARIRREEAEADEKAAQATKT